ncbi:MAG: hypothetical protein OXG88_07480, partial [Gammaproteobacteria bacterium]|nr:hypothetical protein [Gammaproteobacteria bacterium]
MTVGTLIALFFLPDVKTIDSIPSGMPSLFTREFHWISIAEKHLLLVINPTQNLTRLSEEIEFSLMALKRHLTITQKVDFQFL